MADLSEYSRKWRPASHTWPIAAAALLGVAVAVSAWFAVSVWEQRLARAKFCYRGELGVDPAERPRRFSSTSPRSAPQSPHTVDPDEFALFTGQLNSGKDDVMCLLWCPRVTRKDRAAFQTARRENGSPDSPSRPGPPAWHQDCHRRFRHRLLLTQISHPIPGQPVEARAGIRPAGHRRLSQRRRGQGCHQACQRAWARCHCRGRGDRRTGALPARRRLRASARLLFQPAGDGAKGHRVVAGRTDPA